MTMRRSMVIAGMVACCLWLGSSPGLATTPAELKLATWNLEWFVTPETARALTPACLPRDAPRDGARRALPCDIAHAARSHEDIAALRRHARRLDADVIALQEVDGPEAARLVFPGYEYCFSSRVSVQNIGFAIRRGLDFTCGPELTELSLKDDVRRGVELRLFPGTPRELRMLSVHLKSGCSRDPLDNTARASCPQLAAQVPVLERWIDSQAAAGIPFAVLGDFNRDLRREPPGPSLWKEIDDAEPPNADLVNTAEGQGFENCSPAQTFSGYIDYILLDRQMARGLVAGSFGRELFRPKDALRRQLSDHCPVFIRLRVADATARMP